MAKSDHVEPAGLAGETIAAVQRVSESKSVRKAEKSANKDAKKVARQAKKAAKHDGEDTEDLHPARFTPKRARNAIGVAKVVAPAVLPVLAPYAVRAAGAARDLYDRYQARRIGVAVDQLGEFTGRGARLHARIAGVAEGCADLRELADGPADTEFATRTEQTLRQLAAAVRTAERMPAPRRKAAHRAVALELDDIERDLLTRLHA